MYVCMYVTRLFNTICALNDKFPAQNHILSFMFLLILEHSVTHVKIFVQEQLENKQPVAPRTIQ